MAEETTQKEKSSFETKFTNILLSLISFAIISGITALFSMNGTLIRIEERDKVRSEKIDKMEASLNKMQLDVFDLKGKVSNLERSDNDRKSSK